ncbi:MAG: PP2C family protein-serine/threonine phosphatase [Anaerolineae bacterium]
MGWDDLEVQVAVAKIGKYATSESGDTVEMVERPNGGLSVVVADGQRSGRSAKAISNVVVHKALALLAEGVRDGAAARAAHDYLRTHRSGQVSATLNIISVDLTTSSLVVSRNSPCPALLLREGRVHLLDAPSEAVGIHPRTRPVITEVPLEPGLGAVVFTDGIVHAGPSSGGTWDVAASVQQLLDAGADTARTLADALLEEALRLDQGRPRDDMTVAVVWVLPSRAGDKVRRLEVRFPLDSH